MPRTIVAGLLALAVTVVCAYAQSPIPPPWAYTVNPAPPPGATPAAPAADPAPQSIPGSAVSLTVAQTRDAFNPPDWFPEAHPPMPASVSQGRILVRGAKHLFCIKNT